MFLHCSLNWVWPQWSGIKLATSCPKVQQDNVAACIVLALDKTFSVRHVIWDPSKWKRSTGTSSKIVWSGQSISLTGTLFAVKANGLPKLLEKCSHGLFEIETIRPFPSMCPVSCAVTRFKWIMCQPAPVSILLKCLFSRRTLTLSARLHGCTVILTDHVRSLISSNVMEHLVFYFASVHLFTVRAMSIRERRVNSKKKDKYIHTRRAIIWEMQHIQMAACTLSAKWAGFYIVRFSAQRECLP